MKTKKLTAASAPSVRVAPRTGRGLRIKSGIKAGGMGGTGYGDANHNETLLSAR